MAIEYLGLSEINGPLVALEGVKDAAFDEIVEFSIMMVRKNVLDVLLKYMRIRQ